ncbi:type VI secretion system baseplate subunit TssE [Methylococcus sp. EFPC2]|uniref:type VI secretion system baseplate subunit TssE n=1 Tax=Methylococcus sp. EFPC2 TaxID=2812648 RepID=UPI001968067E|nr:type VI secretion system baseplate subunit TssE [Methylococcus sp. EFPC2]QSA96401.1 type VI secretion system baseplate subunit TssE [Methylococcus sp. EFPC2]
MAELTQKERLQPSLLDRLTDDEPGKQQESRDQRVLSMRRLRASVLRDLAWLLNSRSLDSAENLDHYPQVARSVVNFGIKDLSGVTASGANMAALERRLKQAILNFEPRIMPNSLRVQAVSSDEKMSVRTLSFNIEGYLWAQPLPVHLYIRTEFDVQTGDADVRELNG